MLHGETTTRSDLDPATLVARLREHGVAQLADEAAIWVAVDGVICANRMPRLWSTCNGSSAWRAPGRCPATAPSMRSALAGGRRGLLYHRLFSSHAPGFVSESVETQAACWQLGGAAPAEGDGDLATGRGFDDIAVWDTIWAQGQRLVCRVQHRERLVERLDGDSVPSGGAGS